PLSFPHDARHRGWAGSGRGLRDRAMAGAPSRAPRASRWGRYVARADVDTSREMLLNASKKPGLRGRLMCGDLCRLPFQDGCADQVICAFSLGYIKMLEQGVKELSRPVKEGGSVIVSDFHPEGHARGWKRAFRSGAHSYEIENYPSPI